jgi:hypothetical protein
MCLAVTILVLLKKECGGMETGSKILQTKRRHGLLSCWFGWHKGCVSGEVHRDSSEPMWCEGSVEGVSRATRWGSEWLGRGFLCGRGGLGGW